MQEVDVEMAQMLAWCVSACDTPVVIAEANDDYPIVYVNPAFETMTGYPAPEVLGRNCRFLQGTNTDPATVRTIGEKLRAGQFAQVRLLNYRADGTPYWCELHISAVRDATGAVARFVGVLHDVTDDVAHLEKVAQAANRDPLTRLVNRVTFAAETERELLRATRHDRSVGVLFLDLDQFKHVNDTHGHTAGDEYLLHIARTLRGRLRAEDLSARHGGDEFTVLLTDLPPDDIDATGQVVTHLRHALAEPFTIGGVEHRAAVTIGAALFPRDGRTVQELIAHADADMYRRKAPRTPSSGSE